jgi:hypothetical protein
MIECISIYWIRNSNLNPIYKNILMEELKLIFINWIQVGERIRVILDCDDNTLAFERNYEFLGVAFRGE